jgi:hypothetical protein
MSIRGTTKRVGRFGSRTVWVALGALATWLVPPPASAAAIVAGACVLDVTLDAENAVDVVPAQPTWTVSGSGDCVVTGNIGLATGTLNGTLTAVNATSGGCAAGAYLGSLAFEVVDVFGRVDSFVAVAAMVGPVLLVAMATPPSFAGGGVFAQTSTLATAACPMGVNDVTTWKGAFVFEDPTV